MVPVRIRPHVSTRTAVIAAARSAAAPVCMERPGWGGRTREGSPPPAGARPAGTVPADSAIEPLAISCTVRPRHDFTCTQPPSPLRRRRRPRPPKGRAAEYEEAVLGAVAAVAVDDLHEGACHHRGAERPGPAGARPCRRPSPTGRLRPAGPSARRRSPVQSNSRAVPGAPPSGWSPTNGSRRATSAIATGCTPRWRLMHETHTAAARYRFRRRI